MMTRKKRRLMIILAILIVLLTISTIIFALYLMTDMFKSSKTLFTKYIVKNADSVANTYQKIAKNEYNELLQQNKYTTESNVKMNYTRNIGTTSENTENSVNQMQLKIKGQVDKLNQYNYQEIQLLNNNENLAKVEYIKSEDTYGIRFSDLFKQYLLVRNENLNQILEDVNIPEKIELNDFRDILKFSEEEKQNLRAKYINIISKNISKESFSKQKEQTIEINKKSVNVNAYILTLTKEQMNNIYIKILEELKQDEIILSKMEQIQSLLEKYQLEESRNVKEEFVKSIEETIAEIIKNNIGQEEVKITVYENYHNTVRTLIQNQDSEITFDILSLQNENYIQLSYKDLENKTEEVFTYKKEEGKTTTNVKTMKEQETKEYSFISDEKVNGNTRNRNMVAKYEDSSNKIEVVIEQENNIVSNFEQENKPNEENSINLSDLEQEELQKILGQVQEKLLEKMIDLGTNKINTEDVLETIKATGITSNVENLEGNGVSETERKRYNSKFEILQGDEIEGEAVIRLIGAIKDNFADIELVSDTELKLKIEKYYANQEMVDILSEFIEDNKNEKYSAKVQYDETTGLVDAIVLKIL